MTHPPEINARLTIPAAEALSRGGNAVHPADRDGVRRIVLRSPPQGLVAEMLSSGQIALRMDDEPTWSEVAPTVPIPWDVRGSILPCPACGSALAWDEAGRVPGARVCLSGHKSQLSADGSGVTGS